MGSAYFKCPKCGNTEKISRGNTQACERYVKFKVQRGDVCKGCERQLFQEQHDAKVAAAAADPINASLPALAGTEKQVAWALALRIESLPKIEQALQDSISAMKKYVGGELTDTAIGEICDGLHLLASEMRSEVDANKWIDRRISNHVDLIQREFKHRIDMMAPTAAAELKALGMGV